MNNQRGGIISSIFIIPLGVALMVAFFFLGYYVGRYQSKTGIQTEVAAPLPEIQPTDPSKREDFTFYKTLSDKENKTVSIDLKPKPGVDSHEKKAVESDPGSKSVSEPKKEGKKDNKVQKTESIVVKEPETKAQTPQKSAKIRYTLQLASYPEKSAAVEDVKMMKQRGYAAFVTASELEGKGMWYRVRVGSFSNKASAEKLQKELQSKEGIKPFVTIE